MKNTNVLVTGGAGYIGSVLIGLLLNNGYNVRTIDKLFFSANSLIRYLDHTNFELYHGDICDEKDLETVLDGADIVVHLAAIVGDPACQKYSELADKVNRVGSELLCRIAIDHKVKRFIFASTCSNYGRMNDPDGFVDETSELKPVSLYAEQKVGFEKYLLSLDPETISATCLRFSTAYGLSPRPRFDLTVNEFSRDLYLQKELEIFGGQFWRPYCHTSDLSRAILTVVESPEDKVARKAFNVGANDQNFQKEKIVELILKQLPDSRDKVKYVHKNEDPRDYRVNFDLINESLGYNLTMTVEDGISEIIDAIDNKLIVNPMDKIYSNLYLEGAT